MQARGVDALGEKGETMSDLSAERAKVQFKGVIDEMKKLAHELMKTRVGRDSLRRDLGCGIEGFEDEDKEWFSSNPYSKHK